MSTARPGTGRRRPVLVAALGAVAVLAASGCSFQATATHGSPSASASSAPATAPTASGAASSGAASSGAASSGASPGTGTPGSRAAGTTTSAAPSTAPPTGRTSAATPTRTTRASTGSAPLPCRTADLRVSVPGGEGTAGSVHTAVQLVNTGAAACALSGHPGVSFVAGDDGHQVGAAAAREGTDLAPVTLPPGAAAHAPLRISGTGDSDPATCRPVPVTGLRVYPPDQTASAFAARPGTACADGASPQLTVGTVVPGPGS